MGARIKLANLTHSMRTSTKRLHESHQIVLSCDAL
jgi:hypothetical protein